MGINYAQTVPNLKLQQITFDLLFPYSDNVGLASTCNSVGQSLGVFIGHAVFLNLASKDFSNKYFRSEPQQEGVVTLASFMVIWSGIYFVTTTLIFIFKHEGDKNHAADENTIVKSYVRLYEISKLPAVRMCILFQMTKGVSDSVFGYFLFINFWTKIN